MARAHQLSFLAAICLVSSCASFQFEEQQVFLRYRPDTDVLDALLVYKGIGANEGKEVPEDAETLARIGQGARHFILMDWFLEFDLDEILEKEPDPEDVLAKRFFDYAPNIRVLGARLVCDQGDRLCLLQRIQVIQASGGLRLLDAALNRAAIDDPHDVAEMFAEEPSVEELWLQRARANGTWARFDGGVLEVSIPMTPKAAARALQNLLEDEDEDFRQVLQSLSEVRVTGDELLLYFAPGEDGWIRFEFRWPDRKYARVITVLAERIEIPAVDLALEIQRLLALE